MEDEGVERKRAVTTWWTMARRNTQACNETRS
jgi:hypothetical protein